MTPPGLNPGPGPGTRESAAPTRLRVTDLDVFYGAAQVLAGVGLQVHGGEIVAVVGPNGSGKSTLFRTIQGLLPGRRGQIWLDTDRIDGLPAHEVVARGLTSIPEGRRLFLDMTVQENLEIGAYLPAARSQLADGLEQVYSLFPSLRAKHRLAAAALSGGEQQMLALGRGLMGRPRVLLLDDPFMGLEPRAMGGLSERIRTLAGRGIALLVAGQHVRRILGLAARAYLLEQGQITAHAPASHLLHSARLRQALLSAG